MGSETVSSGSGGKGGNDDKGDNAGSGENYSLEQKESYFNYIAVGGVEGTVYIDQWYYV